MKRSLMIILCLCALLSVQAQNISNGSKWWSGSDLYTATVRAGGVVYFQGSDYNELTIEKVGDKAGTYKIIPSRQAEDSIRSFRVVRQRTDLLCVVNSAGAFSISVRKV